ncbi:MAG: putative Ig domain-containing protein [Smithella sp.]
MCLKSKKGSILITLIVAILIMAVLGLGIYTMFSSSSFSELLSNRNDNAYQLAKAGIRFAVNVHETTGTIIPGDYLMPDSSHKFNLAQIGNVITSTGIVNAGTFLEARRVLTYTLTGVTDPRIPTLPTQNQTVGTTGAIANDGTTITLGGSTSPGVSQSYGAIWYNGNNANANCNSGACSFGYGLRAYFEFQFPGTTNSGDGFTFAIMSAGALTNTNNRVGGFSKTQYPGTYTWNNCTGPNCSTSVAGGELQGYAGPGNTDGSTNSVATDGLGLKPPKMAIQFDTVANGNHTPYYLAQTRNDPACSATSGDYVALQFWGDTPSSTVILKNSAGANVTLPLSSFDDNTHGLYPTSTYGSLSTITSCVNATATVTTTPAAAMTCPPVNGLGAVCYLMEDGNTRSGRIEITRSTNPVSGGTYNGMYQYQINVWVELKSSLSALQLSHIQDVLVPYTDTSAKISQTVYFNSTDHGNLANIFWGFTQGTGDLVQQVAITNTDVFFPNMSSTCSYAISPANATYKSTGGSGSVTLTATSNCYWAVQSLPTNPWITITSTPLYGLGSGTISYTVAANTTGAARTGLVNIAGQTFTVIQTAPQTIGAITFTPSTLTVGGTTTASATATSGLPVTFTSTTPTICTVNGSTVTGVATGTCTIAANQAGNSSYDPAPQVTGSITVACQTVTINTTSLPNGRVGTAYSQTLSASGGTITSWAISSGSLPGGLSLNTSTGVISGMPTTGGIFNFTVKATNGCGSTGTQTLSIGIAFNPYQVYAGTGAPMYYVSGSCQTLNSGSYVNLSYNNSVTFYRNSGCTTGSTYTVTYSLANTTDVNANGQVTVNRNGNNWSLVDR